MGIGWAWLLELGACGESSVSFVFSVCSRRWLAVPLYLHFCSRRCTFPLFSKPALFLFQCMHRVPVFRDPLLPYFRGCLFLYYILILFSPFCMLCFVASSSPPVFCSFLTTSRPANLSLLIPLQTRDTPGSRSRPRDTRSALNLGLSNKKTYQKTRAHRERRHVFLPSGHTTRA